MRAVGSFLLFLGFSLIVFAFSTVFRQGQTTHQTPEVSALPTVALPPSPDVQGAKSGGLPNSKTTPTSSPSATPYVRKRSATIALFGDSMIHTMDKAATLKNLLETAYSDLSIGIVNLAVGATTIEDGLRRIQLVIDQKPDIIVVESFAYNHLTKDESGLSRHRQVLQEIIASLKANSPSKIMVLVTIAPLQMYAKDASESAGWSGAFRKEEADWIKRYLENAITFATAQSIPLVDAYHKSLSSDGYGRALYVNPNDDIHPSEEGHALVQRLLSEKIVSLGWLSKR